MIATGCSIADRELYSPSARLTCSRENAGRPPWRSRDSHSPQAGTLGQSIALNTLLTRAALPHLADDLAVLDPRRMPSISSATRFASSRSRSGLRSHGSTISAMARAHGASRCHTTPTPKNAGTIAIRTPSWLPAKSSIAVRTPLPGPPSLRATHSYRRPASATPASSGARPRRARAAGGALRERGRGRGEHPCGRAASPSWKINNGSSTPSPLTDQPQLPAHGVVVVIAVDDQGVRERKVGQGVLAGLADEPQLRELLAEPFELGWWLELDRGDSRTRARRPLQQRACKVASVGPDLDDRLRPDRFEARTASRRGWRASIPTARDRSPREPLSCRESTDRPPGAERRPNRRMRARSQAWQDSAMIVFGSAITDSHLRAVREIRDSLGLGTRLGGARLRARGPCFATTTSSSTRPRSSTTSKRSR